MEVGEVSAKGALVLGLARELIFVEVPFFLNCRADSVGRARMSMTVLVVNCLGVGWEGKWSGDAYIERAEHSLG